MHNEEKSFKSLQRLQIFSFSKRENRKGKPLNHDKTEFIIPSPYEILNAFCLEIVKRELFSKVERVAPAEANCIIRVFEKRHLKASHIVLILQFTICSEVIVSFRKATAGFLFRTITQNLS